MFAVKSLGYKTFNKWIDESYDDTLDDVARMNKIVHEVEKLNNLSYSDLSAMLKDMLPVLTHNIELYMSITKQNTVKSNLLSNIKRLSTGEIDGFKS